MESFPSSSKKNIFDVNIQFQINQIGGPTATKSWALSHCKKEAFKNNLFQRVPVVLTPAFSTPFTAKINSYFRSGPIQFMSAKRVQKVLISLVKIHHNGEASGPWWEVIEPWESMCKVVWSTDVSKSYKKKLHMKL